MDSGKVSWYRVVLEHTVADVEGGDLGLSFAVFEVFGGVWMA